MRVEITSATVRRMEWPYQISRSGFTYLVFKIYSFDYGNGFKYPQSLEKVVYFAGYIVTECREDEKKKVLKEIEEEFRIN